MRKATKADIFWLISFLLGLALILYKCRFGFANIDESYYLAIPYRFWQGDRICLEEWNLGQTASVLIYPFFKLFMKLNGSTEGILLAFRYLFTLLHSAAAVFLYGKLRTVNWGAGFASILYLLYAPLGIMALSYNSIPIALIVIAAVLLYRDPLLRPQTALLAGLAFSGAVLCCPHLILVWLAFGAACLFCHCRKKFSGNPILTLKCFLYFTLGCGAAAIAFLLYLFSKCTLPQFFQVIPLILDDPSHHVRSIGDITLFFMKNILFSTPLAPGIFGCAFVLALSLGMDKNRQAHKLLYFSGALLLTLIYTLSFGAIELFLNHMMFPLTILGLFCFLLEPEKLLREFVFLWIPGMLYAFCTNWASTQAFLAISGAACISSIGSIVMIAGFLKKNYPEGNSLGQSLAKGTPLLLGAFLLATAYIRYESLFWEYGDMKDMTYPITVGSQKGIIASPDTGASYEYLYWDTTPIRQDPSEKVLYFTQRPWLYLDDTKENAGYSPWLVMDTHSANKLISYYQVNPQKLPDVVFYDSEYWQEDSSLARFFADLGYQTVTYGSIQTLRRVS